MKDRFISQEEAKTIVAMGFHVDEWKGEKYLELIPGSKRQEWDEEQYMLVEVTDAITLPKLRIDQAAKWLREQYGVDLVVSPRFDSATGERKGYFVRWSQRTDLQIDKATYRTYEVALSVGIGYYTNSHQRSNERTHD